MGGKAKDKIPFLFTAAVDILSSDSGRPTRDYL